MVYVAAHPESYKGQNVGTGPCVAFVQKASGAPQTAHWSRGQKVRGDLTIAKGTAIATFDVHGKYTNSRDGTSHAAIYVSQDASGITVWDQWNGQAVHERVIHFRGGAHGVGPVNDGDAFYVIN